ncbi:hypothetical protein CT0861_08056, partial [Colletotrichum tofieldiae]
LRHSFSAYTHIRMQCFLFLWHFHIGLEVLRIRSRIQHGRYGWPNIFSQLGQPSLEQDFTLIPDHSSFLGFRDQGLSRALVVVIHWPVVLWTYRSRHLTFPIICHGLECCSRVQ